MIRSDHSDARSSALREREKELDCVYALAALLSSGDLSVGGAAEGSARLLAEAMGDPGGARIAISLGTLTAAYPLGASEPDAGGKEASAEAISGERPICRIRATYGLGSTGRFSERERSLLSSVASILAGAAERLEAEKRERSYREDLERKNAALSELLSRIELEKAGIRSSVAAAARERVVPLVARLAKLARRTGDGRDAALIEARILKELDEALSRGAPGPDDPLRRLSVRELEVCDLVASGLSSKEIAEYLSISRATVERHRHNARAKLGLPPREGSIAAAMGVRAGNV
ncbi:MAG: LuxR C-terminal-related transcriptional regulator [Spirochaetes bacterium]|nr:LuxR C-terminal-related transcriptional regulator [Spirochaetota bacterium]MBU1079474.1 LuxR C-terminal-related transcriptional regulator [Spirochaetota bacterium]